MFHSFKTTQGNASVKAEGLNVPNTRNQTFSKRVDVKTVGEINPPLLFCKGCLEKVHQQYIYIYSRCYLRIIINEGDPFFFW